MRYLLLIFLTLILTACGFHLRGEMHFAPPLYRMYLKTPDPYGHLARNLRQYLKTSHVELVASPPDATLVLAILQDDDSEELLSVSGTDQTRQYNLKVTVVFEILDAKERVIVGPQTLTEGHTITVQSNQILGSSNEATLFYQRMRRSLAYQIIHRIASKDTTKIIMDAFSKTTPPKTP